MQAAIDAIIVSFYLQARHTSTEAQSSYSYIPAWDHDDWPLTIDVSWKTARLATRDYSYSIT